MSQSSWFKQRPPWINVALIPIIGGGAIAYAGYVIKNNTWIAIGVSFACISAVATFLPNWAYPLIFWSMYLGQIITAFMFKQEFLAKTYPRHLPLPNDTKLFQAVAAGRPKVEINSCSKDDLVNRLGISIIYANDIMALRDEGYTFTYAEELTEILGIPPTTVQKISPFITFSYYEQQYSSWKRVNHLKVEELIGLGLESQVAIAIAQERTNGEYKSLMDIKKRTGIPFNSFRQLA